MVNDNNTLFSTKSERKRTFSFCLNDSGSMVPLTMAKVSSIFNASSIRPLASNHLGDSGRNLSAQNHHQISAYCFDGSIYLT
jgi:hypothetical protein